MPLRKEVPIQDDSSSNSSKGYLAIKRSKSKKVGRSASADIYYKKDFLKRNMNVSSSRTKSVTRRAPSVPKKDRFGNSIREVSVSKKSKSARAPSFLTR